MSALPSKIRFVAFGGVWLDEIRWPDRSALDNVPGGSVAFATLGARLFVPEDPEEIALVFKAGHDFPGAIVRLFEAWKVGLRVISDSELPSARGVVHYGSSGNDRYYHRLTSPLIATPYDLNNPQLLRAECFHFFDTPSSVREQLDVLSRLRTAADILERHFVIWEPQAKSCSPETLADHLAVSKLVDVISPNHSELSSFFHNETRRFDRAEVEKQASAFAKAGIGSTGQGCIVVRCAEHGCLVHPCLSSSTWLPSYWSTDLFEVAATKVVDPTGAGNAFLGGFAIGWQETGDHVKAAMYGQVAASLVIEQVGFPECSGHGDDEKWNGVVVRKRLAEYYGMVEKGSGSNL